MFDDSRARADWGWNHDYDISRLCEIMFEKLRPIYRSQAQTKDEGKQQKMT